MKVEARVAIRMELQGQQDVEVSAWKVTQELKTGWGFMGSKMLSGFGWRYKSRFRSKMLSGFGWRYNSRFRRWSGWKEMPELSTGWIFKASKIMKW